MSELLGLGKGGVARFYALRCEFLLLHRKNRVSLNGMRRRRHELDQDHSV